MTERESLTCGVLFVGAGPASLSGAIRLMDLIQAHNAAVDKGELKAEKIDTDSKPIMVIEKAPEVGLHQLSGAILDPKALAELVPDYATRSTPAPFEAPALHDQLVLLLPKPLPGLKVGKFKLGGDAHYSVPVVPPTFHNDGNHMVSLNKLTKWLADIAREKGVQVLEGFPGAEVLYGEDDRVVGVRTGDKGVDKYGQKKDNYQPGNDLLADVTIFGEGPRGSLTKDLIKHYKLDAGKNPQIYSTGVKELWKVPPGRLNRGQVIHTSGFPLKLFGEEFGGGFIYALSDELVALGFVVSLDSPDPYLDPHRVFSEWKNHPFIREILEGGEVQRYGAKTIPEGGWFSIPRPYMPGAMIVGDSAGYMNMTRLKGIHLAMKSGMCAGEAAFDVVKSGRPASEDDTRVYWNKVLSSWVFEELWKVRNFRQMFQDTSLGFVEGAIKAGAAIALGGALLPGKVELVADHERMRKIPTGKEDLPRPPAPDGLRPTVDLAAKVLQQRLARKPTQAPKDPLIPQPAMSIKSGGVIFDKVTSVYHSGSIHDEDQPPHLVVADTDVCHTRCAEEYGNPCQYFCPAAVYEMVETDDGKGRRLRLNFSNCVHCKTCDIRDPYQIITWVVPEGGGGPKYDGL